MQRVFMTGLGFVEVFDGKATAIWQLLHFFLFIIRHCHREFILVSNDFTEAKVLLLSCLRLETARPCDTLVTMR